MHDAAAMGDARAIARRLERGEHPDQGILSRLPSGTAAAKGKTSAVVALLDGGANADSRDVNGRTPSALRGGVQLRRQPRTRNFT